MCAEQLSLMDEWRNLRGKRKQNFDTVLLSNSGVPIYNMM
jgi:hypothetical protein